MKARFILQSNLAWISWPLECENINYASRWWIRFYTPRCETSEISRRPYMCQLEYEVESIYSMKICTLIPQDHQKAVVSCRNMQKWIKPKVTKSQGAICPSFILRFSYPHRLVGVYPLRGSLSLNIGWGARPLISPPPSYAIRDRRITFEIFMEMFLYGFPVSIERVGELQF